MGKKKKYALQILDFTLNMPHEILGPVAPPHPKRSGVPPPGNYISIFDQTPTYLRDGRYHNT